MDQFSSARQKFLFALLYLCEGAPIGFIWWTLPTELRSSGMPIETITAFTSLLVLPWTLKFLWAPLVDIVRTQRWGLRSWIMASQGAMGVALLPMLLIDGSTPVPLLFIFFFLHSLAAATQDVSIDALCIAEVDPRERSVLNGWMQAGMLVGRSLFGGGAILLLHALGMKTVLAALIFLIWGTALILYRSEPPASISLAPIGDRRKNFRKVLNHALSSRTTWLGMLFAVIAGAAYESVGAVAGPFFIDKGFSKEAIGGFFSIFSILAMLAGAFVGGYGGRRWGIALTVALSLSYIIAVVGTLATYHLFPHAPGDPVSVVLMTALYLGIGMFTSASYALFMNITDERLGATQFSAFMGGTNICESWSGYTAGVIIAAAGYSQAWYVMGTVSVLSLVVLHFLSKRATDGRALE